MSVLIWHPDPFHERMHGTFDRRGNWITRPNETWREFYQHCAQEHGVGIGVRRCDVARPYGSVYIGEAMLLSNYQRHTEKHRRPAFAALTAFETVAGYDPRVRDLWLRIEIGEIAAKAQNLPKSILNNLEARLAAPLASLERSLETVRGFDA